MEKSTFKAHIDFRGSVPLMAWPDKKTFIVSQVPSQSKVAEGSTSFELSIVGALLTHHIHIQKPYKVIGFVLDTFLILCPNMIFKQVASLGWR